MIIRHSSQDKQYTTSFLMEKHTDLVIQSDSYTPFVSPYMDITPGLVKVRSCITQYWIQHCKFNIGYAWLLDPRNDPLSCELLIGCLLLGRHFTSSLLRILSAQDSSRAILSALTEDLSWQGKSTWLPFCRQFIWWHCRLCLVESKTLYSDSNIIEIHSQDCN